VAWRIVSLIRQRVKTLNVMIPHSAYSAATLVALGANEIIMHPNGHIGPVDMQITTYEGRPRSFSTEDITAFLDFVRENLKITDQEHIRILFELTCKEVGSLGIGFTARSSRLAVDLGERLLALHMQDDDSRSKLRTIVENMSRKFQSHAYPVNRTEAIDLGLPVKKDVDNALDSLLWKLWLDIAEELQENSPFHPLYELMKSSQAPKLLSPVPQLDLPKNAPSPTYFTASVPEITAATPAATRIDPVDFECRSGLVESSRMAYALISRGKILSCRTPDLMIQYNVVTTSRGWEKVP
jgi:hypothetical protein